MIKFFPSVLLAALMCIAATPFVTAQELSAGIKLSPQQKASFARRALNGSASAAREIALFHGTRDDKLFEYWTLIGAENGDPLCQYNYGFILKGRGDAYSQLRAIYWLKKSSEKIPEAKQLLYDLQKRARERANFPPAS